VSQAPPHFLGLRELTLLAVVTVISPSGLQVELKGFVECLLGLRLNAHHVKVIWVESEVVLEMQVLEMQVLHHHLPNTHHISKTHPYSLSGYWNFEKRLDGRIRSADALRRFASEYLVKVEPEFELFPTEQSKCPSHPSLWYQLEWPHP
jgi:hypothetical protein